MSDPNFEDFQDRVRRIRRSHRKGGVPGRAAFRTSRRRGHPLIFALLVTLLALVAMKGAVRATLGMDEYEQRVATLARGGPTDRIGAVLMRADPLSVWLSIRMRRLVR